MDCRSFLAHQRLTPGNCHDLLFDDVIRVHEAPKDHYDFVLKMHERGVEVLELHDLLAETIGDRQARDFVLDRRIIPNVLGTQVLHFGRPSARLGIAQPPLSRRIAQFEKEIGAVLIDRSRNQIRLTQTGELLLERAPEILERTDQTEREVMRIGQGVAATA